MFAGTPEPGPAPASSLLYLPANYLRAPPARRPCQKARGHGEYGACVPAPGSGSPAGRAPPRGRAGSSRAGAASHGPRPPAASRVGAGRGLQPLLKFESRNQQVRNPEIPDPLRKMFSPEGERRAAGAEGGLGAPRRRLQDLPAGPGRADAGCRRGAAPRSAVRAAGARPRRRSVVRCSWCSKLFILCVYICGWSLCAWFFFVWKTLCVVSVVWGGSNAFFSSLKTKNLSLPFLGCTENTAQPDGVPVLSLPLPFSPRLLPPPSSVPPPSFSLSLKSVSFGSPRASLPRPSWMRPPSPKPACFAVSPGSWKLAGARGWREHGG